tara:strand:+ start:1642 stop:1770 length:129 start_codon:yes stop_codon:yes gene_type:complete
VEGGYHLDTLFGLVNSVQRLGMLGLVHLDMTLNVEDVELEIP